MDRFDVAKYQGRMSIRFMREFDTTIYADTVIASFDTREEAETFVKENEESVFTSYWDMTYFR